MHAAARRGPSPHRSFWRPMGTPTAQVTPSSTGTMISPRIHGLRTDDEFSNFMRDNKKRTVLVEFGSSWCVAHAARRLSACCAAGRSQLRPGPAQAAAHPLPPVCLARCAKCQEIFPFFYTLSKKVGVAAPCGWRQGAASWCRWAQIARRCCPYERRLPSASSTSSSDAPAAGHPADVRHRPGGLHEGGDQSGRAAVASPPCPPPRPPPGPAIGLTVAADPAQLPLAASRRGHARPQQLEPVRDPQAPQLCILCICGIATPRAGPPRGTHGAPGGALAWPGLAAGRRPLLAPAPCRASSTAPPLRCTGAGARWTSGWARTTRSWLTTRGCTATEQQPWWVVHRHTRLDRQAGTCRGQACRRCAVAAAAAASGWRSAG
jgi:hypothetical protein